MNLYARCLHSGATLETHGFALQSHPTAVVDFEDSAEVSDTYYSEIRNLVKEATGASDVFVFDHTLRQTGSTSLNAATASSKAAPVPRVHCDYTTTGAPRRLLQLGKAGIDSETKGRTLTDEEVQKYADGRFAFINVWRSIDGHHPVLQNPLAVCDERSVAPEDKFLYELRFADRTGENYSLQHNADHKWYYYPKQTKEECLLFKVFDKKDDGPRFVFHTAFDDPLSPPDAPPRTSIEVRTVAFFDEANPTPPVFWDMKHSNNAARIRLWLGMEDNTASDFVQTRMVQYTDLQSARFRAVNPLGKVPGLVRSDGITVFESNVILQYLEDKFGPLYTPESAEDKQLMNLQMRVHDLYIASPNCTAPGFSHSQGSMYLSNAWHGVARGMDIETRAAKFAEMWKQLLWMEDSIGGKFLVGDEVTLSDFTWFPTCVFMEFMLPLYGWNVFSGDGPSSFPRLARWYSRCREIGCFAQTRGEILEYWDEMEGQGQFEPILEEIKRSEEEGKGLKFKYP